MCSAEFFHAACTLSAVVGPRSPSLPQARPIASPCSGSPSTRCKGATELRLGPRKNQDCNHQLRAWLPVQFTTLRLVNSAFALCEHTRLGSTTSWCVVTKTWSCGSKDCAKQERALTPVPSLTHRRAHCTPMHAGPHTVSDPKHEAQSDSSEASLWRANAGSVATELRLNHAVRSAERASPCKVA